jgi:hypothetical protein
MVRIPVLMCAIDRAIPKGNKVFSKEVSSSKIFIHQKLIKAKILKLIKNPPIKGDKKNQKKNYYFFFS